MIAVTVLSKPSDAWYDGAMCPVGQVYSVRMYDLDAPEAAPSAEDRSNILPSASFFEAPRGERARSPPSPLAPLAPMYCRSPQRVGGLVSLSLSDTFYG